jgi:hypothetical protein
MIAGSNPAEDDRFLSAIKIRRRASFTEEVKPSVTCKILGHVKDLYSMNEILVGKINGHF